MDSNRELTLEEILESLNKTPDEVDQIDVITAIYKYHETHPRYHYRDITDYVIETEDYEDIAVISENLEILMKWMEEESRKIPCTLSIHECDMVRPISKASSLSCHCPTLKSDESIAGTKLTCNQFKEVYFVVEVLHDHIQLEYKRSVLLQDHSNKLEQQYKEINNKIEKSIDDLNSKERDLYLQIVTILGIFTSIVFAVFGGFGTLTSLIGSINTLSDVAGIGFSISLLLFATLGISSVFVILLRCRYVNNPAKENDNGFIGVFLKVIPWLIFLLAEIGTVVIIVICLVSLNANTISKIFHP